MTNKHPLDSIGNSTQYAVISYMGRNSVKEWMLYNWLTELCAWSCPSILSQPHSRENESRSVLSDTLRPHGLHSPWNSPGQSTGVGTLSFSKGSSQPRDPAQVSSISGGFFTRWATREAQEYWSGWPILSPADHPNPRIEPRSPALQVDSLLAEIPGKPPRSLYFNK